MDNSLVVLTPSGMYKVSDPIADIVHRELVDEIDHQAVFDALKELINDEGQTLPRLELYRVLFRAGSMANVADHEIFHLGSDLIRIAAEFYHQREYGKAIQYGRMAVAERPESPAARDYLIRALIQEEQWDEAQGEIPGYQAVAPLRDVAYLRGFLERKRGKLLAAIGHYEEAKKLGRAGSAIQREIALAHYLNNNIRDAKKSLRSLIEKGDDRIALDLWIQIAERERDEAEARRSLVLLEALEYESYYYHRISTVELTFGHLDAALTAAQKAVSTARGNRPSFGMLAQLATCQIRAGKFQPAEQTIARIGNAHPRKRVDVRLGLLCRLEISRSRYAKALEVFANIRETAAPVYKAMKRDALAGELVTSALNDRKRIEYQKELDTLNKELVDHNIDDAWRRLIK